MRFDKILRPDDFLITKGDVELSDFAAQIAKGAQCLQELVGTNGVDDCIRLFFHFNNKANKPYLSLIIIYIKVTTSNYLPSLKRSFKIIYEVYCHSSS